MKIVELMDGEELILSIESQAAPSPPAVPSLAPTLIAPQGSEVRLRVPGVPSNRDLVLYTTVPAREEVAPIDGLEVGGSSEAASPGRVYRLTLPNPGAYLYHLAWKVEGTASPVAYGAIIVSPGDRGYWPSAEKEVHLLLDDRSGPRLPPTARHTRPPTPVLRNGLGQHRLLVNGQLGPTLDVPARTAIRLHLLNASFLRTFHLRLPGAQLKLVGSDAGRVEIEHLVEQVLLAPLERSVVDILLPRPGRYALEHRLPGRSLTLAGFDAYASSNTGHSDSFPILKSNSEFEDARRRFPHDLTRKPDIELSTLPQQGAGATAHAAAPIGAGPRLKVRFVNRTRSRSAGHHLVQLEGGRFLVLSRDGDPSRSFAYKDTLLLRSGEVVDLVVETHRAGPLTFHCTNVGKSGDRFAQQIAISR